DGSFSYTPMTEFTGLDSFSYKANDGELDSNTMTVAITVTDTNAAPTDISLSNSIVAENSAVNTIVGILSTTDSDAGDSFRYSIVGGDIASFYTSDSSLRTSEVFDFETKASYIVTIRTEDEGGLTYDKTFPITVTNVNETPVIADIPDQTIEKG